MALSLSNKSMRFALKHLFLLLFVLTVAGLLTYQNWPSDKQPPPESTHRTTPNLSILVTRLPGTDLLYLFVQNLDPANGVLISQEVFTLQRLGNGATIAHYTSSSPNFLSPASISPKQPDGTLLTLEQQTLLQAWMREQLEVRLRQLDAALLRKTKLGVFMALRLVHEGAETNPHKQQNLHPWLFLPAKQVAGSTPSSNATATDLQLQIALDTASYENLETFAKRLADEYQQRSSTIK